MTIAYQTKNPPSELRKFRLAHNVSAGAVADRMGYAVSTVLCWERGERAYSQEQERLYRRAVEASK